MEKTIWTPRLYGSYDFSIYLDRNFAREMIQSKCSDEIQKNMNKLANSELNKLRINWSSSYMFHENSCFIDQFSIGQNGVWLSLDRSTIDDLITEKDSSKPIEYTSHNVDDPKQVYALMKLFSKWIEYADNLKS